LSVAAFLRRAGGSMLESTGSHGRGVERRVPEMRRMVVKSVVESLLSFSSKPCGNAVFRSGVSSPPPPQKIAILQHTICPQFGPCWWSAAFFAVRCNFAQLLLSCRPLDRRNQPAMSNELVILPLPCIFLLQISGGCVRMQCLWCCYSVGRVLQLQIISLCTENGIVLSANTVSISTPSVGTSCHITRSAKYFSSFSRLLKTELFVPHTTNMNSLPSLVPSCTSDSLATSSAI